MPARHRRQIVAAVVGNAFEWYDFILFGYMAVVISRLFFPAESAYASLLLTTATFGVGFFMRPVGGVVLGLFADRHGRKPALQLVIAIMTAATATIAFAPTYATIGIAAPLIVIVARLMQGFATGGEFPSATAFLIETAPDGRRGFYGSWQMAGQGIAVLAGALVAGLVTRSLGLDVLESWGWRLPFVFGLLLMPVGLYIRRHMAETDDFLVARVAAPRPRLGAVVVGHPREILACMGVVAAGTISFFVILLNMPTFATLQLHLPLDVAFAAQAVGLACMVVAIPLFGALSDRIGRKPVMLGSLGVYLVVLYPLFVWIHGAPTVANLIVFEVVLCGLLGAYFGPFSTALAEQFSAGARSTGLAVAYNGAVLMFGGFAQFFVTWLGHTTGSPVAPVYYVLFGTALGLVATVFMAEPVRQPRVAAATLPTGAEASR